MLPSVFFEVTKKFNKTDSSLEILSVGNDLESFIQLFFTRQIPFSVDDYFLTLLNEVCSNALFDSFCSSLYPTK